MGDGVGLLFVGMMEGGDDRTRVGWICETSGHVKEGFRKRFGENWNADESVSMSGVGESGVYGYNVKVSETGRGFSEIGLEWREHYLDTERNLDL